MHTAEVNGDMPFTPEQVKARVARLNGIYKAINNIPEVPPTPAGLARKITLFNEAQGVIGELYAQAVYDYENAYNERKEQQAVHEMSFIGTGKEKEAYSETKIVTLRRAEAKANSEMKRWEKAYHSTEQVANAIKHELTVLFDDYRAGGRT